MSDRVLRLVSRDDPLPSAGVAAACRVAGCALAAGGQLGFCATCERRYRAGTARRGRLAEALGAHLAALGNPLAIVFGARRRDFGAHVLAHLEELDGTDLHVPAAAVDDYLAELDARAWEAG